MRITCMVLTALVVLGLSAGVQAKSWDFEDAVVGKLPAGWAAAKTGSGPGSVWKVLADAPAPSSTKVIAQTSSDGPKPTFNLCVADATSYGDLDMSVVLKAVRGKIDQGGGLLWRSKDADNYYVVRVNPLEANFRLYKVVAGKRTQLASADVEPVERKWQTIRVLHQGDRIRCFLDGRQEIDVKDSTFREPGKIGLWTKADAVTSFDNLSVNEPKQAASRAHGAR